MHTPPVPRQLILPTHCLLPAELSLRHLVISRKVSGGIRPEQDTESKMTLASIFGT